MCLVVELLCYIFASEMRKLFDVTPRKSYVFINWIFILSQK